MRLTRGMHSQNFPLKYNPLRGKILTVSPAAIEDLCVGLGFISFVYSLHLASNILFAERNSLSRIMFILLLIGAGVNCRWIAARIPVRVLAVLGVNGWPFPI